MFESRLNIENKTLPILKKNLDGFLEKNTHVYCKALKKKVYLSKLPEVITNRKSSAKKRLACFQVALDILKHSKIFIKREYESKKEFSIEGLSSDKKKVEIHLREETNTKKDKKIYFISCFYE